MFKYLVVFALLGVLGLFSVHILVEKSTEKYLFNNFDKLPKNKVGLVLGTVKILKNGRINHYYKYRLQTAVELYKSGKIQYLLLSGDNRTADYNEPKDMHDDLLRMGIPDNVMYLDHAGFRTLDSVVRCKEVFGQQQFTIVSQKFHNERALFIARKKGLDAVAANARTVGMRYSVKVQIRELLARVKMLLDLYILNKKPHFLGKKVKVGS